MSIAALVLMFAIYPDQTQLLERAIRASDADTVALLIRNGASATPRTPTWVAHLFRQRDRSPLELAILYSDLKTIEVLLVAGALRCESFLDESLSVEHSAMTLAFHRSRYDVGLLLVRYGAVPLSFEPHFLSFQSSRESFDLAGTDRWSLPIRPLTGPMPEPW